MLKINYLTYWIYITTESLRIELKNHLFDIFELASTTGGELRTEESKKFGETNARVSFTVKSNICLQNPCTIPIDYSKKLNRK